MRVRRWAGISAVFVGTTALALATWAGVAAAVSGGGYTPQGQGCPTASDSWSYYGAYPYCHNINIVASDGSGHTYAEAGTGQEAQGQNLHSGTVLITPNGDGNVYGDPEGSPYNRPGGCPDVPADSAPPSAGQQEIYQHCEGAPAASRVTGPGVGASFDTNYQPIPKGDCGAEDVALTGVEWVSYVAGQDGSQCSAAPVTWAGPPTPLTGNTSKSGHPWDLGWYTSPSASWLRSIAPGWNVPDPSTPPAVTPWVQAGTPDTNALDLVMGGQLYAAGDDNLNTGEHDGMDGQYGSGNVVDSSPDGGGLVVDWQPVNGVSAMEGWTTIITRLVATRSPSSLAPIAENPAPVANAGLGAGFDGPYVGIYTNRRTLYHGGGGGGKQSDIYNYSGRPDQPVACNNGSAKSEAACQDPKQGGTQPCPSADNAYDSSCGANYYGQKQASDVTSEPGVMVYDNPDPQTSQNTGGTMPAAYAGTCGVVAGGGQAPPAPKLPSQVSPLVSANSAGQVVAADPTGC